jgi:hypothetical protein
VEKKIARAQKRLEDDEGSSAPVVSVENDPEVLRLTAEIHDTMARAEKAGVDLFIYFFFRSARFLSIFVLTR